MWPVKWGLALGIINCLDELLLEISAISKIIITADRKNANVMLFIWDRLQQARAQLL